MLTLYNSCNEEKCIILFQSAESCYLIFNNELNGSKIIHEIDSLHEYHILKQKVEGLSVLDTYIIDILSSGSISNIKIFCSSKKTIADKLKEFYDTITNTNDKIYLNQCFKSVFDTTIEDLPFNTSNFKKID